MFYLQQKTWDFSGAELAYNAEYNTRTSTSFIHTCWLFLISSPSFMRGNRAVRRDVYAMKTTLTHTRGRHGTRTRVRVTYTYAAETAVLFSPVNDVISVTQSRGTPLSTTSRFLAFFCRKQSSDVSSSWRRSGSISAFWSIKLLGEARAEIEIFIYFKKKLREKLSCVI